MEYIIKYTLAFSDLFVEMSPYLLLGFLIAGILHVYLPAAKLQKFLGGKNMKSVLNSALFGIPLPLCSCGVIPTGVSLYQNGASKGSTVSFLISTPQTGVDSILATYSLLGLPMAILRPLIAFVTGVIGGGVTNKFVGNSVKNTVKARVSAVPFGKKNSFLDIFKYAFFDFMSDISKWLIIGLGVAALIAVVVPDDFFTQKLDNEYLSMVLVLIASVPLYVCATGSIPIAAVLLAKGMSPGAAVVFLMAGPATNAATITVISKVLGKKALFTYLSSIIIGALFFGVLINLFLPGEWFALPNIQLHEGHGQHLLPVWLMNMSAITLATLLINDFYKKIKNKFLIKTLISENDKTEINKMEGKKVRISGMTCNHCKMNVEKNLASLAGISKIEINLEQGTAFIQGENIDLHSVKEKVESIGYEYQGEI